jgi:hypothetical protein
VHNVTKQLVELCVEGARVLDLCVKGDELLEAGTGAVYNKAVKGVKVTKGACLHHVILSVLIEDRVRKNRHRLPYLCLRQQRRLPLFASRVRARTFLTILSIR